MNRYKESDRIVVGVCSMSENLAVACVAAAQPQWTTAPQQRQQQQQQAGDIALCRLRAVWAELARDLQRRPPAAWACQPTALELANLTMPAPHSKGM